MSSTYIHLKHKQGFSQIVLRALGVLYFVALALAVAYLWLFTQDRFVSTAEFKISRQDAAGMSGGLAQIMLPGLPDSGSMDSQIAIGYINSADLLLDVEEKFDLFKHYTSPKMDLYFRLDPEATLEDRLAYYRERIAAHFNKDSGLTVVTVDSFDPKLSSEVAKYLLQKSEAFINRINYDIASQQNGYVNDEVARTSKNVEELNAELLSLQNRHNFISPDEAITSNLKAVEELKMGLLRSEGELSTIIRDSPDSPRIESIRSRIRSLNELIASESAKLTGPEKDRLSQVLVEFKQLQLRLDFALQLRNGAQMMMEKNRTEAMARSRFFTVIQHPYVSDEAAIPKRPYATVTLTVLGLFCFWILSVIARSLFDR